MNDPIKALQIIQEISTSFGIATLAKQIEICERLSKKESLIDIAIFGRFKAGKSSFLNQIVNQNVLPIGVVPVTAIVTKMRYGEEDAAQILYRDCRKENISLNKLGSFISEQENPKNIKGVDSVEITLQSLKPFAGLQFIDTPGTGSVFKHNTETSLSWLPEAGAAFVAISIDPPLSEQDIELIRELSRFTPKIHILLTKADLLTSEQLQEVIQFIRVQTKSVLGVDFQIHPFSIYPSHQHFKVQLVETLLLPLVKMRESVGREILHHKISNLVSECKSYLQLAEKAAQTEESIRRDLSKKISEDQGELSQIGLEIQVMRRELIEKTRPAIISRFSMIRPMLEQRIFSELKSQLTVWKMNLWHLSQAYHDWHRKRFLAELGALSVSEYPLFQSQIDQAKKTFLRIVESFEKRLSNDLESAIGISLKKPCFTFDLHTPRSPDISVGRVFDTPIEILWFVIPMFLFRRSIHRHFLKQIPYEVEKNLSRLASQWAENINRIIEEMALEAERFMKDEIRTIQGLLIESAAKESKISASLKKVEELQQSWRNTVYVKSH